jgi:uncharacterized protein (DUF1330 family)
MKKGYWISLYSKIDNQDNLKKYAEVVTPIIKSFGGKPLVRGGKYENFEGENFSRTVVGNFQVLKKQLNVITQKNTWLAGI